MRGESSERVSERERVDAFCRGLVLGSCEVS